MDIADIDIEEQYHAIEINGIVPDKSKLSYYAEYQKFKAWKEGVKLKKTAKIEAIVGVYLDKRGKEVVSTSLFPILTKIKACLAVEEGITLNTDKLHRQIKQKIKEVNHVPKQAAIFSREDLFEFFKKPDKDFMILKVNLMTTMITQLFAIGQL